MVDSVQSQRSRTGSEEARSVWLRPHSVRREPPLSRDRIVAAAVDLLDAEGVDRLTMRRLADRLDVGATTLYWHVRTKDDVIDLAVDSIFSVATPPQDLAVGTWRDDIHDLLVRWRRVMLEHPWSAGLPARRRPSIGPSFLAWMEFLQARLEVGGFRGAELSAATWLLHNHVMGATAAQANLMLSADERVAGQQQLERHKDRYPTLVKTNYLLDDDWDGAFLRGLEFLLDGLAAQTR